MFRNYFLTAILLTFTYQANAVVIKQASEIFKKWTDWQRIYKDINISKVSNNLSEDYLQKFKENYENSLYELNPYRTLLQKITHNQINEYGYNFSPALDETFKMNIKKIYSLIDTNVSEFVNVITTQNTTVAQKTKNNNLEKNLALMTLLFSSKNNNDQDELLFTVANKFFRHCFSEETFSSFQRMIQNPDSFELTRFFYSTIWFHLAGTGWKNWSHEALNNIKKEADKNKTIIYIAGGSDVFQLLKQGIYNIKIIDPQLPSQTKYYTNDWAWLTLGTNSSECIGDEIHFQTDKKNIKLTRSLYQETGEIFKARLANGQIVALPKSITVWNIIDENNEQLGSYTFERRFVTQQDFVTQKDEALLISFNELFFICLPDYLNGWGIEPSRFPDNTIIHVKQLHEPVNKQISCNMRVASILNSTDLQYISLGTCIN